jgi:Xaa-Pro aminopeptidase
MDWPGRLSRIQAAVPSRALDALVVSSPVNVTYLTGFAGSASLLVLGPERRFLIADGRYQFAARDALSSGGLAPLVLERFEGRYEATLAALVTREGFRRIGFEAAHVTVATLAAWQRAMPGVEWISTERVVEKARSVKDAAEIGIFRRAGERIARVAGRLGEIVTRDRTEREVADGIDRALRDAGFERPAFPTIVASGPNSAHPHARPSTRRLAAGDLVVLDFGGVLDGYCVDLTRMAAAPPVASSAMALYEGVLAANRAATEAVRPGVETSAVDAAARRVLEARGLGEAFMHATGHGLGLEIHEGPRIARADLDPPEVVEAGMVFTIEPGAYVEGIGGVRLEDDVLVTAHGCEVLTRVPHDLLLV